MQTGQGMSIKKGHQEIFGYVLNNVCTTLYEILCEFLKECGKILEEEYFIQEIYDKLRELIYENSISKILTSQLCPSK